MKRKFSRNKEEGKVSLSFSSSLLYICHVIVYRVLMRCEFFRQDVNKIPQDDEKEEKDDK